MAGIWKNNPETPEGKYPIVLRRDGTVLTKPYFVLVLGDPGAGDALRAYADKHQRVGSDPQFVTEVYDIAREADRFAEEFARPETPTELKADPDAPPHRKDDPVLIAWARSVHRHFGGGA